MSKTRNNNDFMQLPYKIAKKDITPFFRAVLNGDKDKIEQLLNNGIDLGITDSKGRNAAFYAVVVGKLDTLKLLIQKGLSADFIDPVTGDSLLHVATSERHMHILYYLVKECHVDVNIKNKHNHTVIYDCLVFTQMETACFLIENGAKRTEELHHEEAFVRYLNNTYHMRVENWIKRGLDYETMKKYEKNIQDFEKQCSSYEEKLAFDVNALRYDRKSYEDMADILGPIPENLEEIMNKFYAKVESIFHSIGMVEYREVNFYYCNLNFLQLKDIIRLFSKKSDKKQIRKILWECYFRNWITNFSTTLGNKFMYPAYLLPFSKKEMERDWHKPDCEGIDVVDFIKDIDTFLPKFGYDYYLIDKGFITIPHDIKDGSFDDVKVEISEKHIKDMGVMAKYELMKKAWNHVEREENWLWYCRLCFAGRIKMEF